MARRLFTLPKFVGGFDDYFEFNAESDTVLAALGYGFARGELKLPRTASVTTEISASLRKRIGDALRVVSMTSETARREFLLAPLMLEVALVTKARLHSEFPVEISPLLHGNFDFFLEKENAVVIVEAKHADMTRGFTQLCAQMVAADAFAEDNATAVYGAVSLSNIWQFAILDRASKMVTQDIALFRVPADLDDLLSVLIGILNGEPA